MIFDLWVACIVLLILAVILVVGFMAPDDDVPPRPHTAADDLHHWKVQHPKPYDWKEGER